ncbi:helix-turn-helix transcriptional regulator [Marinimicrobium sp. ABcell2]|uniref:helix-turn-helix transcriptional regulator n=1 Tax=Marinimicrobium sp. ABcell2 TaxID=3069751 RepID=UPI0027B0B13A|nr:helix-turn-helix transcriptional regulator [Marinimicrobium sp. ABcell2]MDQ2077136.1 helix-turn-helix transcriptional regulator [Marinimicrobium sp. ABcell2]
MNDTQLEQRFETRQEPLLDKLYSSALDAGQWQHFLGELIHATDSRSARLLVLNKSADEVLHSTKVNIDDRDHQRYIEHYVNTCPWRLELAQKPRGQLYSTFHDFSCRQPAFYQTEFFNDWARHLDIHHGICGTVYQTEEYKVQLLVQRTHGQGPYSQRATQLVNGLLPHMRQTLRLSRQSQHQAAPVWGAAAAAEMRALPFILFDKAGRVVHVSQACEHLIQQGELDIVNQRLVLAEPAVQQRFHAAFTEVTQVSGTLAREAALNIRRPGQPTLRCMLTPIAPSANVAKLWPCPAHVALYIYDPEQALTIDQNALIAMYNLTDSEARVAVDIAQGLDPQFIAERDNRSTHTVRAQLKSIFNKTLCHRQNQLAALILQSPAARRY